MTNPEFADWLRRAKTLFPQVRRMIDDMPIGEQGDTQIFWFERLKSFDMETAYAALDTLFETSKRLFAADWFSAYFGTIRGVSSERKRELRRFDGEVLSKCEFHCTEDGVVFIECDDQKTLDYYCRSTGVEREVAAKRFPMAVACSCGNGERLASNGLRRLRPSRDVIHGRNRPEPTTNWKTQGEF
jgi:hypothetical protein